MDFFQNKQTKDSLNGRPYFLVGELPLVQVRFTDIMGDDITDADIVTELTLCEDGLYRIKREDNVDRMLSENDGLIE